MYSKSHNENQQINGHLYSVISKELRLMAANVQKLLSYLNYMRTHKLISRLLIRE